MSNETCAETLADIIDVVTSAHCEVFVGGDFNLDMNGSGSVATLVNEFCYQLKLTRTDQLMNCNDRVSIGNSLGNVSLIDYFLVFSSIVHGVSTVASFVDIAVNFSDHIPVLLTCYVTIKICAATCNIGVHCEAANAKMQV
jgi:endonuclease/exonuclease/phosphatase family metal-dependent hydrolase